MLLRFIGDDGSMGLKKGKIYDCDVYTAGGYVWIRWNNCDLNNPACPYRSFKNLFENWEEVGE